MKRLIVAASLAVLATSAFAVEIGKPFEQLDLDRALPNIPERAPSQTAYPFNGSAPYDQLAVDRALPDIVVGDRTQFAATAGETRSDAEIASEEQPAASPWANDHNFIAPAP
jgi:hypothetical protein